MIFIVNFETFNRAIELERSHVDGSLEPMHYKRVNDGFELYFKNYVTVITDDSIENSGRWDSSNQFMLSYLSDAIEVIDVRDQLQKIRVVTE